METNIDVHIRHMERASADELVLLSRQLEEYVREPDEEKKNASRLCARLWPGYVIGLITS